MVVSCQAPLCCGAWHETIAGKNSVAELVCLHILVVTPEKEEEDKLERFFYHMYDFHNPVPNAPVFVPAELPPRYAISFVPAVSAVPVIASPAVPVIAVPSVSVPIPVLTSASVPVGYSVVSSVNFIVPSFPNDVSPPVSAPYADNVSEFSVVSSANFVPASFFTSSPCIGTTQ